jgi:hypothetical protein
MSRRMPSGWGVVALLPLLISCGADKSAETSDSAQEGLNGADASWSSEGPTTAQNGQVENVPPNDNVIGAIHAVVAHPTDADVLYIGAVNGGVWRTVNATAASPNWQALTDFEDSLSIGALHMDPTDSDVLLAGIGRFSSFSRTGGDLSGLLLTNDGGNSWTALDDPSLVNRNISGVYVEGSLLLAASSSGGGIRRSTNGGAVWSAALGLGGGTVFDLAVDPSDRTRFYATVSGQGVFLSTDSGQTFSNVALSDAAGLLAAMQGAGVSNAELSVGNDGRVWVVVMRSGQASYIGHSSDQGGTWTSMDLPRFPQTAPAAITSASNATPIVITLPGNHGFPLNNGNVRVRITGVTGNTAANGDWAVVPVQAADPPNQFTLLGSSGNGVDAGGGQWQRWAQLNPREKPGGQGGIHLSVLVDPNDSDTVYMGGDRQDFPNAIGAGDFSGNLVRGDATVAPSNGIPSPQWEHLTHSNSVATVPGGGTASNSAPHADSRDMAFDADGELIEVDDGGIYRRTSPTDNTGDWFSLAGDLAVTEFHSIAYDPVSGVVIGGAQDNGNPQQSSSGSGTWNLVSTADGGDVQVDAISTPGQSIRYTSNQNLGTFRRTTFDAANNQVSSVVINPTPPMGVTATARFLTPFELNAVNGQRIVIAYQEAVFESVDQGDNIVSLGAASNANGLAYGHASNEELLWAAAPGGVFVRTTAGGALAATAFVGGAQDVVSDPGDAATAYVITGTRVLVTTNTGANWTDVTGDLNQLDPGALQQVTFIPSSTVDRVVVAATHGVYVMAENAQGFWNELGPATLPNAPVFDLDYEASNDLLVVGTMGRGAWSLSASSTINLPPAAICQDITREADAQCLGHAVATDFDDGTIDPEGGPLTFSVDPEGPYLLHDTDVIMSVSDDAGATEQCSATVTVIDVTPPALAAVEPLVALSICDPNGESITLEVPAAEDNCDPDPIVTGQIIASDNPDIPLPLPLVDGSAVVGAGTHTVEWTATDDAGNSSSVTQTLTIGPAIFVTDRLNLHSRARLETPTHQGAAFANSGAGGNVLGVESLVGDIFSVSGVTARNRVRVEGDIFSMSPVSLHQGALVVGSVHENLAALPLPASPALPSDLLPALPLTPIQTQPGSNVMLPPGAYTVGDFKSGVTLSLQSGVYVFDELRLQPQVRVLIDLSAGPVLIVVKRQLTNKATFELSGGSLLDLSLVYLGSGATQFHYPWAGRLFAPNGAVILGSHGGFTYEGQIFVNELEIRPDSAFVCRSDGT